MLQPQLRHRALCGCDLLIAELDEPLVSQGDHGDGSGVIHLRAVIRVPPERVACAVVAVEKTDLEGRALRADQRMLDLADGGVPVAWLVGAPTSTHAVGVGGGHIVAVVLGARGSLPALPFQLMRQLVQDFVGVDALLLQPRGVVGVRLHDGFHSMRGVSLRRYSGCFGCSVLVTPSTRTLSM